MGELVTVDLWDTDRAAQYFGKSKTWIYRECRAKRLPFICVGNEYRFAPHVLARWVAEHSGGDAPGPG